MDSKDKSVKDSTRTFPILSLPVELQLEVLDHVGAMDLARLRKTGNRPISARLLSARHFYCATDAWKLAEYTCSASWPKNLPHFPGLVRLHLECRFFFNTALFLWKELSPLKNLRTLYLKGMYGFSDYLFDDGPATINLTCDSPETGLRSYSPPPHLTSMSIFLLYLRKSPRVNPLEGLPNTLEELVFQSSDFTSSWHLSALPPHLHTMKFINAWEWSFEKCQTLLPGCAFMTKLEIDNAPRLDQRIVPFLPPTLTWISLGIGNFDNHSFTILPQGLMFLRLNSWLRYDVLDEPTLHPPNITNDCLRFIPRRVSTIVLHTSVVTLEVLTNAPPTLTSISLLPERRETYEAQDIDIAELVQRIPNTIKDLQIPDATQEEEGLQRKLAFRRRAE